MWKLILLVTFWQSLNTFLQTVICLVCWIHPFPWTRSSSRAPSPPAPRPLLRPVPTSDPCSVHTAATHAQPARTGAQLEKLRHARSQPLPPAGSVLKNTVKNSRNRWLLTIPVSYCLLIFPSQPLYLRCSLSPLAGTHRLTLTLGVAGPELSWLSWPSWAGPAQGFYHLLSLLSLRQQHQAQQPRKSAAGWQQEAAQCAWSARWIWPLPEMTNISRNRRAKEHRLGFRAYEPFEGLSLALATNESVVC